MTASTDAGRGSGSRRAMTTGTRTGRGSGARLPEQHSLNTTQEAGR